MKITNIKFPTKKRWLKNWWSKNINTFIYATENQYIKEEISYLRKEWDIGETTTDPARLYKILLNMFLKAAGFKNYEIVEKDSYFETLLDNGWTANNPFSFNDKDNKRILVPETKMRLIRMLSNIHEDKNQWIFESRFSVREDDIGILYPSSHITFSILFEQSFFRALNICLLRRLNLDFFIFWPMFFYYILTDSIDFVIDNAAPLIYPVKVFLIKDNHWSSDFLSYRLYGDCNFNEIMNFIKENKKELTQLNKLLGNSNISSGALRDFHIYKNIESELKSEVEIALELRNKNVKNISKKSNNKNYNDYLLEGANRGEKEYLYTKQTKNALKKPINLARTVRSQVKREIENITKIDSDWKKVHKLIDKINNP